MEVKNKVYTNPGNHERRNLPTRVKTELKYTCKRKNKHICAAFLVITAFANIVKNELAEPQKP